MTLRAATWERRTCACVATDGRSRLLRSSEGSRSGHAWLLIQQLRQQQWAPAARRGYGPAAGQRRQPHKSSGRPERRHEWEWTMGVTRVTIRRRPDGTREPSALTGMAVWRRSPRVPCPVKAQRSAREEQRKRHQVSVIRAVLERRRPGERAVVRIARRAIGLLSRAWRGV
jgi:hypothetical protein